MDIKIVKVPMLQTNFELLEVGNNIRMIHADERIIIGKLSRIKDDMIYIENKDGSEDVIRVSDINCIYKDL
jgi:hypothetical protein